MNVGISDCISVYDNVSVGSTTPGALPATLYADNGLKVANLSALNITHPGTLMPCGVPSGWHPADFCLLLGVKITRAV